MTSHVYVPYDEKLLRRTIELILAPQVKRFLPLWIALVALGVLGGVLEFLPVALWASLIALGLLYAFGLKWLFVRSSMKAQWAGIRADFRLDADDEWLSMSYPAFQTRIRWEALERVVETPEAWFMVLGKIHATAVPKSAMTAQQAAEFAALVARRGPVPAAR